MLILLIENRIFHFDYAIRIYVLYKYTKQTYNNNVRAASQL